MPYATDRCFLFEFCIHFQTLRQVTDFLFDKQWVQIFPLHLIKGKPCKAVGVMLLNPKKAFSSRKQVGIRDVKQIINTQLMKLFPAHILRKECLIQPKRANDACFDPKLFSHLTQYGILGRFMKRYSTARQIIVNTVNMKFMVSLH